MCFIFVPCLQSARTWQFDFYSLLKGVHARQQSTCGSKNDSDSLNAAIPIVLVLTSHTSLNQTLCLHALLLLFFQLFRGTANQAIVSYLEGMYSMRQHFFPCFLFGTQSTVLGKRKSNDYSTDNKWTSHRY